MDQAKLSSLHPQVKVFFSTHANSRIPHEVIDLGRPGTKDKIVGHEDAGKWNFLDLHHLWSGMTAA